MSFPTPISSNWSLAYVQTFVQFCCAFLAGRLDPNRPRCYQSGTAAFSSLLSKHPLTANSNVVQRLNLSSDIFTGVSIETSVSTSDLAALPGVLNVWPVSTVGLPDVPVKTPFNGGGAPWSSSTSSTSNYSIHGITGVDELQAMGIKGAGVVVGIVDTGIYYPHPAVSDGTGGRFPAF